MSREYAKIFLEYAAQFLGNLGNYKGFGDSKFIPRCSKETIVSLASTDSQAKELCRKCIDAIYADESKPGLMHLGYPDKGHLSAYYPDSPDITQNEIEEVEKLASDKGLLPENTRLRKTRDGNFEILIASGVSNPPDEDIDTKDRSWILPSGKTVSLVYGDHQEELAKAALQMKQAAKHAANDTQRAMLDAYSKSFATGSQLAFKESQRRWVEDLGPAVECNIGFIESYRDPAGVRAEWEGLVACVNKEKTRKFAKLVEVAPEMIPKLPWPKAFEKDEFSAPDFTSIEVLSFPSSGIPVGINIPNHDDIRQTHGFKNVSLGNILSAKAPNEPVPFIRPEDLETYLANRDGAFEVQVGIHELLGHGTGKLLQETEPGVFNFDKANPPISPLTKKPIGTYYKPGETWSSVFAAVSSSYEECRAELVAMALSCDFSLLKIFGYESPDTTDPSQLLASKAGDVLYTSYLSMARAGIAALEFYNPEAKKWGQAHMQARYSILKSFLFAGNDFCKVVPVQKADGEGLEDLTIHLDRSKILSHGRPAVESYLQRLHIYKATADVEAGKEHYLAMTEPNNTFWTKDVRDLVLKKKVPRKVFVQPTTIEENGEVRLKEYEPTLEGIIQSWAEREV